jgi:hypothetical protein
MSQYPPPSPYQPPQQPSPTTFDYYQPADVLGPARRAGGMMFVLAGVMLLGAFCCGGFGAMLPQVLAQNPSTFAGLQEQVPELTPDMLRIAMIAAAVVAGVAAIAMVALGVFVRRGSKVAVVLSMVLSILMLGYLLLSAVSSLVMHRQPPLETVTGLCVMAIPIVLLGVLILFLYQAIGSSDRAAAAREQYMQQYWQYAYQQQMYSMQQQPGVAPQPPPPTSPPQQFWRPNPPPPGDADVPPPPPPPAG